MIWDVFPFFNELELLDIRLNVHAPYVDRFVLVEAQRTHSNQPKPLYYNENKHLFEKFHNRLVHVVANFDESNPWIAEAIQRDTGARHLHVVDEDIIVHTDLDEIVDFRRIDLKAVDFHQVHMKMYHYYLNVLRGGWDLPQIFRAPWLRHHKNSLKQIRYWRLHDDGEKQPKFTEAGWHFSYMGGPNRISQKIKAFSAQSFNQPHLTDIEAITKRVADFKDVLGRGPEEDFWLKKVEINEGNHPKYVVENQKKFAHLILS